MPRTSPSGATRSCWRTLGGSRPASRSRTWWTSPPGTDAPYPAKGDGQMADNGQDVIELQQKRISATCQRDVATLNSLIADDLIYTHSNARQDTKASLIENMQAGRTVYQ